MKTLMTILAILAIMGVIASDPWAVALILDNLVLIGVGVIVLASSMCLAWLSGRAHGRESYLRSLRPAFDKDGLVDELRGPAPLKRWERFAVCFGLALFVILIVAPFFLEAFL